MKRILDSYSPDAGYSRVMLCEETLSDGSSVYDVAISNGPCLMYIRTPDFTSAEKLFLDLSESSVDTEWSGMTRIPCTNSVGRRE